VRPLGAGGGESVVAEAVADGTESPPALVAITRYAYVVADVNPVSWYAIAAVVTRGVQVAPPLTDRSTR
jgi:hypothetical protein